MEYLLYRRAGTILYIQRLYVYCICRTDKIKGHGITCPSNAGFTADPSSKAEPEGAGQLDARSGAQTLTHPTLYFLEKTAVNGLRG